MAGTSGASTSVNERNEVQTCNSADAEEESNKRMKCDEKKDDLISDLPDCLIHHILSFLPSTKDSIRTCVLSKRWLYQWTRVPVLVFNSKGMPIQNLPNFIDNALILYNSSKINKFVVINWNATDSSQLGSKLTMWIRFATERDVKELVLDCFKPMARYELPQFLFNNSSLIKLKLHSFFYMPIKGKVNWASLKALYIVFADLTDQGIKNVLSGSPVIECLELRYCYSRTHLDFASKSLRTLTMMDSHFLDIEISCPNLEKFELLGEMLFTSLKCKDLPPSVHATLDFDGRLRWVKELLLQVQHVEELKLGPEFLMAISLVVVKDESSLMLNTKHLTIIGPLSVTEKPALTRLLLSCSLLEKLVIQLNGGRNLQELEDSMNMGEKLWELDGNIFECLVSHLKTIEIVNLHSISDNGSHEDVLKCVEFLLKNARMLEKMVLLEAPGEGMTFAGEVCEKLSCIRKASPDARIEVACLSMADLHCGSYWDKIVY